MRAPDSAIGSFFPLIRVAHIGFLFKTEIFPKQLSLLRDIAFDCLSYNFAARGRVSSAKFSSRFLSNRPLDIEHRIKQPAFIRHYTSHDMCVCSIHKVSYVTQ